MEKEKIKLTKEEAIEVMAFNNDQVHTFYNAPWGLIGADHSKNSISEDLENADWIEITGEQAQAMKHGIAIIPKGAKNQGDILFVETDMDLLKELEKKHEVKR